MKVRVTLKALSELEDGREFYGDDFVKEYEKTVNKILSSIEMGISAYIPEKKKVKRQAMFKYPYHMYYGVEKDTLVIVSVFHYRQSPTKAPKNR